MVLAAKLVAEKLGVEQATIEALAETMRPKDGCLWVIDSADDEELPVHTFTADGIDYIGEMLAEQARS